MIKMVIKLEIVAHAALALLIVTCSLAAPMSLAALLLGPPL